MKRALLDVNVLIALLDPDHAHHARARDWLARRAAGGWASCPLTENGCARIMSQSAYSNPVPPSMVIERLAAAAGHPAHEFWPADISLVDPQVADRSRVLGPRQITDVYLLALAVRHEGCFATFDAAVPLSPVAGARPEHLVVI